VSRVVQVIFHPDTESSQGALMCLCEDGTIWDWTAAGGGLNAVSRWRSFPTPDSQRAQREVEDGAAG
jgi:hypothetical protein